MIVVDSASHTPPSPWVLAPWVVLVLLAPLPAYCIDPTTQPARQLGTLLYSAAERTAVVNARQRTESLEAAGNPVARAAEVPTEIPAAGKTNTVFTVEGVVKRERGNSTAWLNGQTVTEGQSLPPANRITISAGGVALDGHKLQVGQTVDTKTGTRTDVVQHGAVTTGAGK